MVNVDELTTFILNTYENTNFTNYRIYYVEIFDFDKVEISYKDYYDWVKIITLGISSITEKGKINTYLSGDFEICEKILKRIDKIVYNEFNISYL